MRPIAPCLAGPAGAAPRFADAPAVPGDEHWQPGVGRPGANGDVYPLALDSAGSL